MFITYNTYKTTPYSIFHKYKKDDIHLPTRLNVHKMTYLDNVPFTLKVVFRSGILNQKTSDFSKLLIIHF